MRVAGIAIKVKAKRPSARLVVLDDVGGSPSVEVHEEIPSVTAAIAEQLHDQAEAIRSRLKGLRVDRVIVRRADRPPRPSNQPGPRRRLLAEGAVTSAARSVVIDTRIGTGKETGEWFGSSKAGVDQAATDLLEAEGVDLLYKEATSAALAGLKLPT